MLADQNAKEYWMCIIGGVPSGTVPYGGDFPLRQAVRDKFFQMFGEGDEICSSGWGINEERMELLRTLSVKSTDDLKKMLELLAEHNAEPSEDEKILKSYQ